MVVDDAVGRLSGSSDSPPSVALILVGNGMGAAVVGAAVGAGAAVKLARWCEIAARLHFYNDG